MNNFISRYGTFLAIPPVMFIIAIIAFSFNVNIKEEVTLVQIEPDLINVYLSSDSQIPETLKIVSPETGQLDLPVLSFVKESSIIKVTCKGNLNSAETLIHGYINTGSYPIYKILLKDL